jgi:hypothetical protein
MKLFWMIFAGLCIIIAAVFLWQRDFNVAFVLATVGLVGWFLNYRIQMKELVSASEADNSEEDDLDEVQ